MNLKDKFWKHKKKEQLSFALFYFGKKKQGKTSSDPCAQNSNL